MGPLFPDYRTVSQRACRTGIHLPVLVEKPLAERRGKGKSFLGRPAGAERTFSQPQWVPPKPRKLPKPEGTE